MNTLEGYRHGTGTITTRPASEDNYAVLAKAVMGYNSGEPYAAARTWAYLLSHRGKSPAKTQLNNATVCYSCGYSIEVREKLLGADHLRTYIWRGGAYPPVLLDNNGEPQIGSDGNPVVHPQAGQAWCFAYGEDYWVNGVAFDDIKAETTRHAEGHPRSADRDARVGCE